MKLLGVLGLDWKILIIQALNFLVLFFVLYKLFFKAFMKALREEKKKSEQIKKMIQRIEAEKKELALREEKEISEMKQKINTIMAEAEKTARKIREESQEELSEKEKLTIERIKKQSQAILDSYKEKMIDDYKKDAFLKISLIFENEIPEEVRRKIEKTFWPVFFKKVSQISLKKFIEQPIHKHKKEFLNKIRSKEAENQKSVLKIKKPDAEIFSAFGLSIGQKKNLETVLKKKLNLKKIKIEEKRTEDLIAGFRLEVKGILIEESLKEKLSRAIDY